MRLRALAVPLLAAGLLALPAEAAPKKHPCSPLLTDRRGDSAGIVGGDADIVSASLVLTKKTLTATLTLAAPPPSGLDPRVPGYELSYSTPTRSSGFRYQPWSATNGTWSTYVTVRGTSIVWSIPRAETGLPAGPLLVADAYAFTYVAGQHADDAYRARGKPVRCGS